MIYRFEQWTPVVHPSAYVHPQAVVLGDVVIGKDVYIGPGAVLRGDWGRITVGDGANVQENCVIHLFPGKNAVLQEMAHIGHGAIVHGSTIGKNVLVGMNAVVMDDVVIGEGSIVGALAFVPQGMQVPARSVLVGNPARVVKEVTDEVLAWKTEGTRLYMTLPAAMRKGLQEAVPLEFLEDHRPEHPELFQPKKK
jgi:carbonic anhydrase/acetyltransferase-like protein (isoleucine patch superfamily)